MNFVDIGNPENANDTSPAGYGGVANAFRMSSYEVSTAMVSKANTAGSLGITYTSRTADMPATSVSWNEAARFVNWLNASSGSVAAYKFTTSGVNDNIALWASGDAGYNAANPFRNSNAKYFLPSENEWYKAAYYDPNKTGGAGYWDYATGSDSVPTAVASGTASGTAVYNGQSSPADITSAGGLSTYGTMGQGGNVWEWMETNYSGTNDMSGSSRGLRGAPGSTSTTWPPRTATTSSRRSRTTSSASVLPAANSLRSLNQRRCSPHSPSSPAACFCADVARFPFNSLSLCPLNCSGGL